MKEVHLMKIAKIAVVSGFSALIAPLTAQSADLEVNQTIYVCERGVSVPVVYINPANGTPIAVVAVEGKLVTLKNERSASGALYVSTDKHDSYRLWSKGDTAIVTYLPAEKNAKEQTLFANCQADVPND